MTFAFVFPGQGSQSVGMMAGYGDDPLLAATFAEAADVLGQDFRALAETGPEEELARTVNTQPLMLIADIAVWRLWTARSRARPAALAGHSLGEYAALVAAGALSFPDALKLTRLRAQLMQTAVPEGQGAMAAILGLDEEGVYAACAEAAQGEVLEPANFNSPGQVVIAGRRTAVERGMAAAKARGARRAVMLPMSVPSHCGLMHDAALKLGAALAEVAIVAPAIPVVHNSDVRTHLEPQAIRQALTDQLFRPVRWVETVQALAARGIVRIVECGPGKVLAPLSRRIDERLQGMPLNDAPALAELAHLLEEESP